MVGNFELHRSTGFLLSDRCAVQRIAVRCDILNSQCNDVAASELAVDRQFTATGSRLDDPDLPFAGEGFWYLVRPACTGASWTSNGPKEATGRDAVLP